MELKDIVKKITKIHSKVVEDAIKVKLNEGYSLEDLEIKYAVNTNNSGKGIKNTMTVTVEKKKKDD